MLPSMDEPTEAIREPVDILAQTISLVGIDQQMPPHKSITPRRLTSDVASQEFLEKYHDRELFHRRSKDSMYRKMRKTNQALEAKSKEKDMLLESRNYKIEALSREIELLRRENQELRVLLGMWKDHFESNQF